MVYLKKFLKNMLLVMLFVWLPSWSLDWFLSKPMSHELVDTFRFHFQALLDLKDAQDEGGFTIKPLYQYLTFLFVCYAFAIHFALSNIKDYTVYAKSIDNGKVIFTRKEKWLL